MRILAGALLCSTLTFAQEFGVGKRVNDFGLQDLAGSPVSFSQLRGATTVVAFIATNCPISNAFNDRMTALYNDYSQKGVKFVFVNSNANESASEVASHRKSAGFPFPVYKDPTNKVADRFGAMATPETYVIDSTGTVRYHGYIEDSTNEARVKSRALRAALDAVLAGKPVAAAETKAFGCSIKRARRTT
jgi:peroxiredoxin